jgi:hypothetical protein
MTHDNELRFRDRWFELQVRRDLKKSEGPIYASELAAIEKLELDNEDHIEDIEYIQYCTGLKDLYISLSVEHDDAEFIKGLTNLEYLSVDAVGDGDFDYGVFAGMRNLKCLAIGYIWFWNVTHSNLSALKKLPRLNDLMITEAKYIDIAPVCEIPELEFFDFSFIGKVENVDAISRIPKLKELRMCDVSVDNLDFLNALDPSVEIDLCALDVKEPVSRKTIERFPKRDINEMNWTLVD